MSKKFGTPNLRVTLPASEEPHDVQTTQADAVRFDLVRARLKWPTTSEAPMLWATFLAWHALNREILAGKRAAIAGLPARPEESLDAFDTLVFLDESGDVLGGEDDELEDGAIGVDPTDARASATTS